MVRLATSIATVSLLVGATLAQSYESYEQYERDLHDVDALEARSEAVLNDYLVARDSIEQEYGREMTDYERREVFDILEARDPLFFSLFKQGVKAGVKAGAKGGKKAGKGGKDDGGENLHVPINIDGLGGLPPSQRSLAEDEALYGRDYYDEELSARDYEDLDLYGREFDDVSEFEAREPFGLGAIVHAGRAAGKVLKHKKHAKHFSNAGSQFQPQDNQNEAREFDEQLEAREPFRGSGHIRQRIQRFRDARRQHHQHQHGAPAPQQQTEEQPQEQPQAREFFGDELDARDFYDGELETREPFMGSKWAKSKYRQWRNKSHGGNSHHHAEQQQQQAPEQPAQEMQQREFEDYEDLLARDFEDFDDLD